MLPSKPHVDLSFLEVLFILDEIKKVTFDIEAKKAPKPDAFLIFFLQKYWSIIQNELVKLCHDFYWATTNIERLNWANIALSFKTEIPDSVLDFHPISLIKLALQIISKILAT